MVLEAPALLASGGTPTTEPVGLTVGFGFDGGDVD